jgi:hypothetical protein
METILDGTVRTAGGRFDVYFERHFDAPLERLGAAVSEPELLEGLPGDLPTSWSWPRAATS